MHRLRSWIPSVIGAGLLFGAMGCQSSGGSGDGKGVGGDNPGSVDDVTGSVGSALQQAQDCPDLLTKIQDDAVMKANLAAFRFKLQLAASDGDGTSVDAGAGGDDPSFGNSGGSSNGGSTGGVGAAPPPTSAPGDGASDDGSEGGTGSNGGSQGPRSPVSSSDTNTQVEGVDEADFVKLVKGGERMFLLHGSKLFALKSWPANETALDGDTLEIEGQPSEMFVTADGKRAVIFSTVNDYGGGGGGFGSGTGGGGFDGDVCSPEYCGGNGRSFAKVTVADVSGTKPAVLREFYYEGSYLSSRRYAGDKQDVVRAVFQGYARYQDLFYPNIETQDAWGRTYADEVIDSQLKNWVERTAAAIRATELGDWLPLVREVKDGKLVAVAPSCDGYYVPKAGLADYGLTHVLSMDINQVAGDLGGITIMGAVSTVYSNAEHLVLAQPDYRWNNNRDFGLVDQQQTALHMFEIDGAATKYEASGWVPGHVPSVNSQFAIDEKAGAIRIATTGWVRDNPKASRDQDAFWSQHTENRVYTTRTADKVLEVAGKSEPLGKVNESITAARFVGDRAYVVTFLRTDPLIVLDLKNPEKVAVLGEIEIPGFSEYMHPIDQNHLVTIGQNGSGSGTWLQMFDVTDPKNIPDPHELDFGNGSSSEARYNHKAFTYFDDQNLLAVPLFNYGYNQSTSRQTYGSTLQVIKVSTKTGFKLLGAVDHAPLYASNLQNCGYCDQFGCYDYSCGYQPEVRRGHFVAGAESTFVYSVSYGGVLVNNLDDLDTAVATVELPAPSWSGGGWYDDGMIGGGEDSGGSSTGGWSNTGGSVEPLPPEPVDAGAATSGP